VNSRIAPIVHQYQFFVVIAVDSGPSFRATNIIIILVPVIICWSVWVGINAIFYATFWSLSQYSPIAVANAAIVNKLIGPTCFARKLGGVENWIISWLNAKIPAPTPSIKLLCLGFKFMFFTSSKIV